MDDAPPDADDDVDGSEADAEDGGSGGDPTTAGTADPAATAADDSPFAAELDRAGDLLDDPDLTAFAVGVVRDGRTVETTFSYRPDAVDADREGIQALTLLAAHVRVVADEAGVDHLTAATDAAALADRVAGTGAPGGDEADDR